MAQLEDKPLTPLFLRLTHSGVHKDGRPNLSSVPIYELVEGLQAQDRKQVIYVPVGGYVDLPIAPRVLLSLSSGNIGKFVRDGILFVDIIARFRDVTDCGGSSGTGVGLAAVTPNIERTSDELCFVLSSGSDSEGFILGETVTLAGLSGSFSGLDGTYKIQSIRKAENLSGLDPTHYTVCVASVGANIAGAMLGGVVVTLPDGKVNIELSSSGSGLNGLGANNHAYIAGDGTFTGSVGLGFLKFCNALSSGDVDENSIYLDETTGHPFFKDISGTTYDLTTGGGGPASDSGKIFQLGEVRKVPNAGTLFLRSAEILGSSVPIRMIRSGTLRAASLSVNVVDASNTYKLSVQKNGVEVETLALPLSTLAVSTTTFTTTYVAGDNIRLAVIRLTGSGSSAFDEIHATLEIVDN